MGETKRVRIEQVKLGMYVIELDQPWHKTPFLKHRFMIQTDEQLERLRQSPVREVVIDLSRGVDVEESSDGDAPPPADANPDNQVKSSGLPQSESADNGPLQPPSTVDLAAAREIRRQAVTSVQRIFDGIDTGVPLDPTAMQAVVTGYYRMFGKPTTLVTQTFLQQLQRFDDNLFAHVVDVCTLCLLVGKDYGLSHEQLESLGIGALLHDVGYLRLPRNVLRRKGDRSAQEQKLWQQHPQLGHTLLSQTGDLPEEILRIVAEHHEYADGSGYPNGLRGDQISVLSQIVGLVDMYDRLISSRGGRPNLTPYLAMREVYEHARQNRYDKRLVEVMVQSMGVYPIGSLVKLDTGERGVVVALNPEQRLKPLLRLVSDPRGRLYKPPPCVDLARPDLHPPERTIRQALDPDQEQVDVSAYLDT